MNKYEFQNETIMFWRSGRMVVEVRSIGHKWVWLRHNPRKRFRKIPRAQWDRITNSRYFKEIKDES